MGNVFKKPIEKIFEIEVLEDVPYFCPKKEKEFKDKFKECYQRLCKEEAKRRIRDYKRRKKFLTCEEVDKIIKETMNSSQVIDEANEIIKNDYKKNGNKYIKSYQKPTFYKRTRPRPTFSIKKLGIGEVILWNYNLYCEAGRTIWKDKYVFVKRCDMSELEWVDHHNITEVYKYGYEYCYFEIGITLDRLDKSYFNTHMAILMINDIAKAIRYLQEHGKKFYDIKPDNIVLKNQDEAEFMLCDVDSIYEGGTTLGYESPESKFFMDVNYLHDIYSLGLCAYWMLTGKSIMYFRRMLTWDETFDELVRYYKLIHQKLKYPKETPLWLRNMINTMTKPNTSDRIAPKDILENKQLRTYVDCQKRPSVKKLKLVVKTNDIF